MSNPKFQPITLLERLIIKQPNIVYKLLKQLNLKIEKVREYPYFNIVKGG